MFKRKRNSEEHASVSKRLRSNKSELEEELHDLLRTHKKLHHCSSCSRMYRMISLYQMELDALHSQVQHYQKDSELISALVESLNESQVRVYELERELKRYSNHSSSPLLLEKPLNSPKQPSRVLNQNMAQAAHSGFELDLKKENKNSLGL